MMVFVQEYEQRLSESGVAVPASEAIWRPSSSSAPGTSHMEMEVKNKETSNMVNCNDLFVFCFLNKLL